MNTPANTLTILTGAGRSAIAVIRLCGPLVASFCEKHLTRQPRCGACVHTQLYDIDQRDTIDDPVAVLVDQQTLDLSIHGGTWVIARCTDIAETFGFRITSFDDLPAQTIEQEIDRDLPTALSHQAIAILLAQSHAWQQMQGVTDLSEKQRMIERAIEDRSLEYLLNPPMVAIVGRPNVGKSTLANQLFGRSHSITADLPGTTRDWVGEQANIDGLVITLIDTPGLRETDDPIEAQAIKQSTSVIHRADLIVELFDATDANDQHTVAGSALHPTLPTIRVINKVDRLTSPLSWPSDVCPVVATTGQGVDDLRWRIRNYFGCGDLTSLHARCWNESQRQRLRA